MVKQYSPYLSVLARDGGGGALSFCTQVQSSASQYSSSRLYSVRDPIGSGSGLGSVTASPETAEASFEASGATIAGWSGEVSGVVVGELATPLTFAGAAVVSSLAVDIAGDSWSWAGQAEEDSASRMWLPNL